jgi:hypothetical protein
MTEFDNMLRVSLANITNMDMTDVVWKQATLQVSRGGLGIRRTEELALSAFLASVHSVSTLISTIVPNVDLDYITNPEMAYED